MCYLLDKEIKSIVIYPLDENNIHKYSVLCYSFLNIFWICTHFLASTLLSICTLLFCWLLSCV